MKNNMPFNHYGQKSNSLKSLCFFLLLFSFSIFTMAQTNVALNKSASQSSNYSSSKGLPGNAVDGNTSGNWYDNSVTHTIVSGQNDPWWTVDLGAVYSVNQINVWNRTDCCQDRLHSFKIFIKKSYSDSWSTFVDGYQMHQNRNPHVFTNTKLARYVKVQLFNSSGILSLAEVEVYGSPTVALPEADPWFTHAKNLGPPTDCGSNSFKDPIYGGTCWTCPEGSKRTVLAVQGSSACEYKGKEDHKPAIKKGRGRGILGTDCDSGQFWDPNGYCYTCPSGYTRTAHPVTSGKACYLKEHARYVNATQVGEYGCDKGFYDLTTNRCWTCPEGYKRTGYGLKSGKACEQKH